jgi:D-3-phosphoglycerate dehydrogenase
LAKYTVVAVDRPAWYRPIVEQEVLSSIDADVFSGWARLGEPTELDPVMASLGMPVEELSLITLSYIPSARHTPDVLAQMAADADAILVTTAKITADVMDRLPRLRVIGRPGIGFDVVDVDAATARGIAVYSAPGFCAAEVADHTMMFALALARKLPPLHHAMRRGTWERGLSAGMPSAYEMTLGLVAFGEISRAVAERAKPFGFKVIAFDPFVDQKAADPYGVTMVSLDELLAQSDIVSVHAPLGKNTFHMIGEREFGLMKPTAYIINTARGPVIDYKALAAALQSKRIAGAGLDVFEPEPPGPDSPLLQMDTVLLTPHTAGVSDSSQIEVKRRTCRNLAQALAGQWPKTRDLVNPSVLNNLRQVGS